MWHTQGQKQLSAPAVVVVRIVCIEALTSSAYRYHLCLKFFSRLRRRVAVVTTARRWGRLRRRIYVALVATTLPPLDAADPVEAARSPTHGISKRETKGSREMEKAVRCLSSRRRKASSIGCVLLIEPPLLTT